MQLFTTCRVASLLLVLHSMPQHSILACAQQPTAAARAHVLATRIAYLLVLMTEHAESKYMLWLHAFQCCGQLLNSPALYRPYQYAVACLQGIW